MQRYLFRRCAETVILLVLISAIVFTILHLAPGGPLDAAIFANPKITAAEIQRLEELLGLDQPPLERYLSWLGGTLRGDWGHSWRVAYGRPVLEVIGSRVNETLILMSLALGVSLAIAIPVGVLSATRPYSRLDYLVTSFSFVGISLPTFWFGIMMIVVFAVGLGWFPTGGASLYGLEDDLGQRARHLVLPVAVLALYNTAAWSRFVRSSLREALGHDYVRTARAKGLRERTVIVGHALRGSLAPIITVIALDIPTLFSGAIVTETVFSYPGMGRLFWDAVMAADWPVVQGLVIISAALVVVSNLAADLAYGIADPRVRYV